MDFFNSLLDFFSPSTQDATNLFTEPSWHNDFGQTSDYNSSEIQPFSPSNFTEI